MKPLMDRLSDLIQREHELLVELQTLAAELVDHVERQRGMTDRLQSEMQSNVVALPPAEENFVIPRVLQSGPARREEK